MIRELVFSSTGNSDLVTGPKAISGLTPVTYDCQLLGGRVDSGLAPVTSWEQLTGGRKRSAVWDQSRTTISWLEAGSGQQFGSSHVITTADWWSEVGKPFCSLALPNWTAVKTTADWWPKVGKNPSAVWLLPGKVSSGLTPSNWTAGAGWAG